jgi:shikimate 5-dehydrogenase
VGAPCSCPRHTVVCRGGLIFPTSPTFPDIIMAKKVAALIGYGPGIGHAVATKWAAEGFSVALVSRTAEKLEAAAKAIPNAQCVGRSQTSHASARQTALLPCLWAKC